MSLQYINSETKEILDALAKKLKISKAKLLEKMLKDAAKHFEVDFTEPAQTEPVEERVNGVLRFRVSEQEREALQAEAKEYRSTVSDILRGLIKKHLAVKPSSQEKFDELVKSKKRIEPKQGDDKKTVARFHLSVTGREKAAIEAISKGTGLRRNAVILSVLRAFTLNRTTFLQPELKMLNQLRGDIKNIGRNFNQIARALNTSLDKSDLFKAEQAEKIGNSILQAAQVIDRQIVPMKERWGPTAWVA